MNAAARHAAVWRQPWQAERHAGGARLWRLLFVLLVLSTPLVLSALWLDLAVATLVTTTGLMALTGLWWTVADGLLRQNRHPLARLVPGHARTLRLQLLVVGLIVSLAAIALLALVAPRPLLTVWFVLPAVVGIAWVIREPLLWLPFTALSPFLGGMRVVAERADALPWGLQAAALMALGFLLARCVGNGGSLHRWADARQQRWQQAVQALQEGRAAPQGAQGRAGRAVQRAVEWPLRRWRRRVLAGGTQASFADRLELGLGTGGTWAMMGWIGAAIGVITAGVMAVVVATTGTPVQQVVDSARFGLCAGLYSLIAGPLNSRLVQLWSRRREQALLALLPGLPAGGGAQVAEQQWHRQWLAAWAAVTVALLALSTFGGPDVRHYVAACAGLCLPMVRLVQVQQRRLRSRPGVGLATGWPFMAAALAAVAQWQAVPAWASLLLGALAYAALAWAVPTRALQLPVGRAGQSA